MSAYWDRVDRQADSLAAAWDALVESDNVTVTLPVTVKVIGFGRRHVWVETEDAIVIGVGLHLLNRWAAKGDGIDQ